MLLDQENLEKYLYEFVLSISVNHYLMNDVNINFIFNQQLLYQFNYFLKLELIKRITFLEKPRKLKEIVLFDYPKFNEVISNDIEILSVEPKLHSEIIILIKKYYSKLSKSKELLCISDILNLDLDLEYVKKEITLSFYKMKSEKALQIFNLFKIYLNDYLIIFPNEKNVVVYYRLKIMKSFLNVFKNIILKTIYKNIELDDSISVIIAKLSKKEISELIFLFTESFNLVRYKDLIALLIYLFYDYSECSFMFYLISNFKNKKKLIRKIIRDYK